MKRPAPKPKAAPKKRTVKKRRVAGVVAAVRRELKSLPESAQDSALAATALALAGELDAKGNSATSRASCARSLVDVMAGLRGSVPEEPRGDGLDDLAARRRKRRAK